VTHRYWKLRTVAPTVPIVVVSARNGDYLGNHTVMLA
jgi:hypothetical protein